MWPVVICLFFVLGYHERYVSKMFTVREPELIHEIPYLSSGSTSPRELTLKVSTVRYNSGRRVNPTFAALSDLQGRETAATNRLLGELVADEIIALQELELLPALDLCLLCGDFFDYPDLRKLGGTGDVTDALNALSNIAKQTFVVLGNHDLITADELSPSIQILDGNTIRTESFTISGVSGIIGNPKRNNRKTESEFLKSVRNCSTSRTDVLMLHQGPTGADDRSFGLSSVNDCLRKRSGLLTLFGHCHWDEPFHSEGTNLYGNVDARVLVFVPQAAET